MRDQPDFVLWQGQHNEEEHGGDFISEARDWAGELISAQTMMGKILVTILMILMVRISEGTDIHGLRIDEFNSICNSILDMLCVVAQCPFLQF